jgi:hypothetical protein
MSQLDFSRNSNVRLEGTMLAWRAISCHFPVFRAGPSLVYLYVQSRRLVRCYVGESFLPRVCPPGVGVAAACRKSRAGVRSSSTAKMTGFFVNRSSSRIVSMSRAKRAIALAKLAIPFLLAAPQRVFEATPLVPGSPSLDVKPHSPGGTR